VRRFWEDATGLFETALAATEEGVGETAILIDRLGGIRIVDASGWRPEALRDHYGAERVYQISRGCGTVRLSGCTQEQSCVLESKPRPVPAWYAWMAPHRHMDPPALPAAIAPPATAYSSSEKFSLEISSRCSGV
jgi:hypothetical protein